MACITYHKQKIWMDIKSDSWWSWEIQIAYCYAFIKYSIINTYTYKVRNKYKMLTTLIK